ncbi:hypothetical protein PG990_001396 [Apiospora arundinis]
MSAEEFREKVENGEVLVDSHDLVLRIAFVYADVGIWDGNGVFDVVDQLHARGWSFGQGALKFNRTLDIFYLTQIAAGIYRSSDQLDGDLPSPDDFDTFYAQHYQLLNRDAWKQYYSPGLLAQATSARFSRPPDLQDLPDSSDPLGNPRQKGVGHFNKLPRWAHNVARTRRRQPTVPAAAMTQIALSTLQDTISRLREDHPGVQPYSETQASFWLKYMKMDSPNQLPSGRLLWKPNDFGIHVAEGSWDTWAWKAHYSRERWEKSTGAPFFEPDLDGTLQSEVYWCGWPNGGVDLQAWWRGWEPEVGSEEEVAFLAAVAAEETKGIHMCNLDYTMRSHMLLAVLHFAWETETTSMGAEQRAEDLERRMLEAGRVDESKAKQWIQQALLVMKPYVHKGHDWPTARGDVSELLRHIFLEILNENGQLFARWKLSPSSKEFNFELDPSDKSNIMTRKT